ncbi:MAG: DUF123 domain-containing protein [Candidatus Thorarchaeota archaeon]
MKGAYALIIQVDKAVTVKIKSLRHFTFEPGVWIYVGSAMGNGSTSLENRLHRHFRKEKTIYWHIDYLLDIGTELVEAIWAESEHCIECDIAQAISNHPNYSSGLGGFGSSDCQRGCVAHIFQYHGDDPIRDSLYQIFQGLDLQPNFTNDGIL